MEVTTSNPTINKWLSIFENVSYNNPMLGLLSFHLIVGQVLFPLKIYKQGIKEDPRVSYFYMQDSGSGKTTALDMITYVEKQLGFKVIDNITKLSDTYLLGSYTEKQEGKKISKSKISGKLEEIDIIHVDEGEIIFYKTDFGKFLINVLNAAANPFKSVGNKVVVGFKGSLETGEEIKFYPHCSVGLTSYEPENVEGHLLRKGLFQRYFFYPRELTMEDRINNSLRDVGNVGKKFDYKKEVEPVVIHLQELMDFVDEHREIDINYDKVRPLLTQGIASLYKRVEYMPLETKRVACEFIARYNHKYYVLCLHHALLSGRLEITREDVKYADNILQEMLTRQLNFIESKKPSLKPILGLKADFNLMLKAYNATKIVSMSVAKAAGINELDYAQKSDMLKRFCLLKGVSMPTALRIYEKLKTSDQFAGLIVEKVGFRNNKKFVKVLSDGEG